MYHMKYRLTKMNDTICIVQSKYRYNDISQYDRAQIKCPIGILLQHRMVSYPNLLSLYGM